MVRYRIRYADPLLTTTYARERAEPVDDVWKEAVEWGRVHGYGPPLAVSRHDGKKEKSLNKPKWVRELKDEITWVSS